MTLDRSYVELNRAATDRMRALAAGLTDEALQHPVGEHWTVAITLVHLAWWDARVSYVLDMTERNGALYVPQIDLIVNDLSLPFWAAIPPRSAAQLAIAAAETLDERLAQIAGRNHVPAGSSSPLASRTPQACPPAPRPPKTVTSLAAGWSSRPTASWPTNWAICSAAR